MQYRLLRLFLAAVPFIGVQLLFSAAVRFDEARDLFKKARDASEIRKAGDPPFHLKAAITLSGDNGEKTQGTYELWWRSPEQFREAFETSDFQEKRIVSGGQWWRWRNSECRPAKVDQAFRMLDYPQRWHEEAEATITDVKEVRAEGASTVRLEVQYKSGGLSVNTFQVETGALISAEGSTGGKTYSDFKEYRGRVFPFSYRSTENGTVSVEASIVELADAPKIPESYFAFPVGAKTWPWCPEPEKPKLIKQPRPIYPAECMMKRKQGRVVISLALDEGGSVKGAQILRSAGSALDRAALDAVLGWKFQPPACGGKPYPVDHIVTINFVMD